MPFLAAFVVVAPLLFFLARFPQSPDGAEMLQTAVQGGVLHPSGMPLQAWINRLAVLLLPSSPGLALSLVSWLGALLTVTMIILLLRRLGVGWRECLLASAAYAYIPAVALVSEIPEKYTWLSFTQMLFVYILIRPQKVSVTFLRDAVSLAVALGLALGQHSANVILLPVFFYVLLRRFFYERNQRVRVLRDLVLASAVAGGVTGLLYLSLLALRSTQVWPDWGHLQSLEDVMNHVLRKDYGVVQLFHADVPGDHFSGLQLLAKGMVDWNLAFLLVFVGLFAMSRSKGGRFICGLLLMIILPGLGVLSRTSMPAADYGTVMGYQERYPLLLWPLLIILWGVGLSWLLKVVSATRAKRIFSLDWVVTGLVAVALSIFVVQSLSEQRYVNNNLVEIYREQAAYELDNFSIFWTGSDFTGFYGVPRGNSVIYPLKNLVGLDWYRAKVVPTLSPAVARILVENKPLDKTAMFRQAVAEGFKVVMTEATPLLEQHDLMAQAEQTGVLWTFSSANSALYTKQLVANTLHLCTLLPKVWKGVPTDGMYFLREYLSSFRYAYMSAADYLQAQMELPAAQAAREVASALVPGQTPEEWGKRCQTYMASILSY